MTRPRLSARAADVLRLITNRREPVFLTVHANGRRRWGRWQSDGRPVALPTEECDALHAAGRIVLGDPVVDRAKTTYRVRAAARGTYRTALPDGMTDEAGGCAPRRGVGAASAVTLTRGAGTVPCAVAVAAPGGSCSPVVAMM
ncbi:hypothetical protein [Streptomyces sp. NPDC001635]